MAAFIQEGKMPVDKDWFTMEGSWGTISLEHSNSKDVGIGSGTNVLGDICFMNFNTVSLVTLPNPHRVYQRNELQHSSIGDSLKSTQGCTREMNFNTVSLVTLSNPHKGVPEKWTSTQFHWWLSNPHKGVPEKWTSTQFHWWLKFTQGCTREMNFNTVSFVTLSNPHKGVPEKWISTVSLVTLSDPHKGVPEKWTSTQFLAHKSCLINYWLLYRIP